MTVHVGELTTDVVAVPETDGDDSGAQEPEWTVQERLRHTAGRLARDRARTAAWGFDD